MTTWDIPPFESLPVVPGYLFDKAHEYTWSGRPQVVVRVPCAPCQRWHSTFDGFTGPAALHDGERYASYRPGDELVIPWSECGTQEPGTPRAYVHVVVQEQPYNPKWESSSKGEPWERRRRFTTAYREWLAEQSTPSTLAA